MKREEAQNVICKECGKLCKSKGDEFVHMFKTGHRVFILKGE